jgi:ATP phosphoribosyltransferase
MSTVRIGLPKGRGLDYTRRACAFIDIELRPGLSRYETRWGRHRIVLHILKFSDIAGLIAMGALDLGVTGEEWLLETGMLERAAAAVPSSAGLDIANVRLGYVSVYLGRLCLLSPVDSTKASELGVIASPYARLARRLTADLCPRPRILAVRGTSESLVPDLADAAIDVVETGRTARLHGLRVAADYGTIATCLTRSAAFDTGPIQDLIAVLGKPELARAGGHGVA